MSIDIKKSNWIKWSKEFKKKKLTETLELTYNLYKKGKSIDEIATMRDFKRESVENHIIQLITKSFLNIEDVIGKNKKDQILKVAEDKGIKTIIPIKEELGENYSYFEIKCVLASLSAKPDKVKKK